MESSSHNQIDQTECQPSVSRKRSHDKAFGGISCIFCSESRLLSDKNVRAAAAKITSKINSNTDKNYVLHITKEWRQLAKDIQHPGLLDEIGTNSNPVLDLRAAEVFYDLSCHTKAKRKQQKKLDSSTPDKTNNQEFIRSFALKQIIAYIESKQSSLKLASLLKMYTEILQQYRAEQICSKSSTFFDLLKAELPELQKL